VFKIAHSLLVLTASYAAGQTLLSPQDAVELALKSHPLVNAGSARSAVAAGLLQQAGLRPNPRFTWQSENWRVNGNPAFRPATDTDQFALLTQPLETGGKRARRMELARAGAQQTELERAVLARQIGLRVQQAYWNAAGAEKVHQLLAENAANFQQIVEYHEARVRLGAMAEADLLKVRLERERLEVSIRSASLDVERTRIALFREMGLSEYPAVKLAELPGEVTATVIDTDFRTASENRVDLKLARQAVERARANVEVQKANAKGDVDLVVGYKRTSGFNTLVGGVQVNLPLSNRNQGSIAAAGSEVRVMEWELASAEVAAKAEIRTAAAEVASRREQLQQVFGGADGDGLRGKASESSRIAQAAYREGGTDLLRLLDAERARIEVQVLYFKTLADYRQSVAALEAAVGLNQ
jgi:cobalt-zinc-cadmium efflux system outer membrane protein